MKVENIEDVLAIGPNVLIKMFKEEDKTEQGVYVPQNGKDREKIAMGEVVSVPEFGGMDKEMMTVAIKQFLALGIKISDIVLVKKNNYVIVDQKDVSDTDEYRMYHISSIVGKTKK